MYEDVLVPTDGSEGAEAASDRAIDLAKTYGAALHTVFVVDTTAVDPDASAGGVLAALDDAGEAAIDEVIRRAEEAGVETIEGAVLRGTPHRAILDYADEQGIDLIVMGTHGRSGIDRVLLGSVTEKVVRRADVPVLTVRLSASEA